MSVIDNECCENSIYFLCTRLSRIKIIFEGSLTFICFIFVEGHVWQLSFVDTISRETLMKTVSI